MSRSRRAPARGTPKGPARRASVLAAAALLLLSSCRSAEEPAAIDGLVEDFVFSSLAMSPVAATGAGYHVHHGVRLDELLDDMSEQAMERQRRFYRALQTRLEAIDPAALTPQQQADYQILAGQIALALLELDTIQSYRHNPTVYVELLGTALFDCYSRGYAPLEERFGHIAARLEKAPALLAQAKTNLTDSPAIWAKVARDELKGVVRLVDTTLREAAPGSVSDDYSAAAEKALAALRDFDLFLKGKLPQQQDTWRLGAERYAQKFRYQLATGLTPEEVLAAAEKELERVRRQMYRIAVRLEGGGGNVSGEGGREAVIRRALERIAARHATPETYFDEARRDLEEATGFVRQHALVPLFGVENLKVIETPEFMRGIYSVGGFNPAPPLETELGAYYWLTPIPDDWPPERIESKLREYNFYGLKLLTIHEAMPGHYVQFQYADRVTPEPRRLLRAIWGNGPYIEGWAVYATEMMLDEGYLDYSDELRLTFLKQALRVLANVILDIRLHTKGMTDEEALSLMIRRTFQERQEAEAKLVRAKLSSCQLPTYFVGWQAWRKLRRRYEKEAGAGFSLAGFHRRALETGAVPLPELARLLLGRPLD